MIRDVEKAPYQWTIESELSNCYLVLRVEDKKVAEYQVKMIQNNSLPNVLIPHINICQDICTVHFQIDGKVSLFEYVKENGVSYKLLLNIVETLIDTISSANEFFLNESNFQLDGNLIFIDSETSKCFYVYVPFVEEAVNQTLLLRSLIDVIIKNIHKNDEKAISLIHKLRMVLEEGNFHVLTLKKVIKYEEDMVFVNSLTLMKTAEVDMNKDTVANGIHNLTKKQGDFSKDAKFMFVILQLFIGAIIYLCITKGVGASQTHANRLIKIIAIIGIVGISEVLIFFKVLFQKELIINKKRLSHTIREEKNMKGTIKLTKKEKVKKESVKKVSKEEASRVKWKWESPDNELIEKSYVQKRAYWVDEQEVNIPLLNTPFLIGNMKSVVDFQVNNESASKIHCQITCEDGNYYIIDLNSRNGTFLNNRKLEGQVKYLLKNTDEIKIINSKYYFKLF